ncbi:unnamed protein product [Clavelina lepadiformis]|uniref:Uncharacterized protein n=1 Tax=Clavelina lepadiformis TaxID=159417 RepID=A0ABP0F5L8_CLALP
MDVSKGKIMELDINEELKSYSKVCENIRNIMTKVAELKSKPGDHKSEVTELRMQKYGIP